MATCSKCQTKYVDGAKFCFQCGQSLEEAGGSTMDDSGSPAGSSPLIVERREAPATGAETRAEVDLPLASETESRSPHTANSPPVRSADPVPSASPGTPVPPRTGCAPLPAGALLPPPEPGSAPGQSPLTSGAQCGTPFRPRLIAVRGQILNQEYPIYEGRNTIGRFADRPVDIDLVAQEAEGQVWSSRLHAAIICGSGEVRVEDLNSLNGTWVNGIRVYPGQQRPLRPGDVLQIGTVQLRLLVD